MPRCSVAGCLREVMGCNRGGHRDEGVCEAEIYCGTHFLDWATGKIVGERGPTPEQVKLTEILRQRGYVK